MKTHLLLAHILPQGTRLLRRMRKAQTIRDKKTSLSRGLPSRSAASGSTSIPNQDEIALEPRMTTHTVGIQTARDTFAGRLRSVANSHKTKSVHRNSAKYGGMLITSPPRYAQHLRCPRSCRNSEKPRVSSFIWSPPR